MKKFSLTLLTALFGFIALSGNAIAARKKFKFKSNLKINQQLLMQQNCVVKLTTLTTMFDCKPLNKARTSFKKAVLKLVNEIKYFARRRGVYVR